VSLPVAGEQCSVAISDKLFLSLRTKEAKIARERFPLALNALNALNAFFESLGQPPRYAVVSSAMDASQTGRLVGFR